MSITKKPGRKYASALRAGQADKTQAAILAAADKLFRAQGWASTSVAAIAREAGISPETIYATLKTKRAIMAAVVMQTVRGQSPDTPLMQQAGPLAVLAEKSQATQIKLFAGDITGVLARIAPLMSVLSTAAKTEPELNQLYQRFHEGRRKNLAVVAEAIMRQGSTRKSMDSAEATAVIWRLASPEMFTLMTEVEGISVADFETWLASSLRRLLLAAD